MQVDHLQPIKSYKTTKGKGKDTDDSYEQGIEMKAIWDSKSQPNMLNNYLFISLYFFTLVVCQKKIVLYDFY